MIIALVRLEIRSIFRDSYGWGGSLGFLMMASFFLKLPLASKAVHFPDLWMTLFWSLLCLSLFLQTGSFFDDEARWGGIDFLSQTPGAFGIWVFIKIISLSIWNIIILGGISPVCFLLLGVDMAKIPSVFVGMVFLFPIIIGFMALMARLCLCCRLPIFMRPLLVGPFIVPFLLLVHNDTDPFARGILMGATIAVPPLCTVLIDLIHRRIGG